MDCHSTTPVDPRVLEAMTPFFTEHFGNAASTTHRFGWQAQEAVSESRAKIAAAIGAGSPSEIVLTSGATEANNLALKGLFEQYQGRARHLVVASTEHPSVLDVVRALENAGAAVTRIEVGASGVVDPDDVAAAIREDTLCVSVMHANNEIGTVSPIAEIGALCREAGVFFHTDAAQSVGKIPFDVDAMNVDLASISAHKLYGPKGVGALFARRRDPRVVLAAQMHGGGHERDRRSGTLPVPLIVGFARALEIAAEEREAEAARLAGLRDQLCAVITGGLEGVTVNGSMEHRLPGNLNLSFEGVDGEALLLALRDIALSSGSACASATQEPSHVLRAIGVSDALAHSAIRFGLGRMNTDDEIEHVGALVVERVLALRRKSAASV